MADNLTASSGGCQACGCRTALVLRWAQLAVSTALLLVALARFKK